VAVHITSTWNRKSLSEFSPFERKVEEKIQRVVFFAIFDINSIDASYVIVGKEDGRRKGKGRQGRFEGEGGRKG
jgi:hypothetical protein